jgi:E3 ubiquitin-protein ligase SHPRH
MKDQNWRSLLDDRHQKVQILVRFAGLQQRDEADRTRYQHALETLLVAEQEIKQIIEDVKAAIAEHATIGEALKQEALASRNARQKSVAPASDDNSADKGKGKAQDDDEASDVDDNDLPRTLAGEEHASKRRALQLRLREYKVTLHKVKFLQVSGHTTSTQEFFLISPIGRRKSCPGRGSLSGRGCCVRSS